MLSGGLTADFYQDKIYFAGKAYPVGYFAMDLLNDFYENDTGARFAVFSSKIDRIKDDLEAGFSQEKVCVEVKQEIIYIIEAAKKVMPFKQLKPDEEIEFINSFFDNATYKKIKSYFKLKAMFLPNNDKQDDYSLRVVSADERKTLKVGEEILRKFTDTLTFYQTLADDYKAAFAMFSEFATRIDESKKCDETVLATTAMDIAHGGFKPNPGFGVHADLEKTLNAEVEYLAIKKSSVSKKLITARRMRFKRFIDFILADFYEGICKGHYPKKCLVCGRYFLMQNARKQLYCNGRDPNDTKNRTCRQVAADRRRGIREKETRENDPIKYIYNRADANIRQYKKRGRLKDAEIKAAKRHIKNLQFRAKNDTEYLNNEYENQMKMKAIMRAVKK